MQVEARDNRKRVKAKYANPKGTETWSGRGRAPACSKCARKKRLSWAPSRRTVVLSEGKEDPLFYFLLRSCQKSGHPVEEIEIKSTVLLHFARISNSFDTESLNEIIAFEANNPSTNVYQKYNLNQIRSEFCLSLLLHPHKAFENYL